MPKFNYVALKNGKDIVKGQMEAVNAREVRTALREQGLVATKIYDAADEGKVTNKIEKNIKLKRLSLKDKIDFTSIFHILNVSGVGVIETLVFMENDSASKNIKAVANEIRRMIVAGATFATAIGKLPDVFDNVYTGLSKAGEDSGEMDRTLERLIMLLKKQAAIKSKVIGALIYPCFVVVLAVVVMLIMLVFVFPAFQQMFESLGKELPITTQICINTGLFIRANWPYILLALIGTGFGFRYLFTIKVVINKFDGFILKLPLIDELMKFANLANFIAVMFVAYEAGIPIVDCLYLSNLTISNTVLREATGTTALKVQQGQNLSSAMRNAGVFPKMLTFMIAAGEQSGRLGEMLEYSSKYIDNELDKIVDGLTKLIEPFMLIVIGAMVLFMALSLYLPLFQSYDF